MAPIKIKWSNSINVITSERTSPLLNLTDENKEKNWMFQQNLCTWVLKLEMQSYLPTGMVKTLNPAVGELSMANVSLLEQ